MLDLLIHNAQLPAGRVSMSVAVQGAKIVAVSAGLVAPAPQVIDAQGRLVNMHCDESDHPLSRHIETLGDDKHLNLLLIW
jgi:cytosine deaminase